MCIRDSTYIIILSSIASDEDLNLGRMGANAAIAKGPFDAMGRHVIDVLQRLDRDITHETTGRIFGLQDAIREEITRELLSSKRHIEVILTNISEGVLELTMEGRIVYANASATRLIGIPEEELLGRQFAQVFPADGQTAVQALLDPAGILPRTTPRDAPLAMDNKQVAVMVLPVQQKDRRSFIVIMNNVSELMQLRHRDKQARQG